MFPSVVLPFLSSPYLSTSSSSQPPCVYYIRKLSYLFTYGLFGVRPPRSRVFTPILFHFPPVLPSRDTTELARHRRSPIGPQWGHNLIYRCTTTPVVLTKIKATFIYWCFTRCTRGSIRCKLAYGAGGIASRFSRTGSAPSCSTSLWNCCTEKEVRLNATINELNTL